MTSRSRRRSAPAGRDRSPLRLAFLAVLASVIGWSCSGNSIVYGTGDVQEARIAAGDGETYRQLAVTPMDPEGYDPQIAGRVHRRIESRGFTARLIIVENAQPYEPAVMEAICAGGEAPIDADGVIFVTWDQLVLRDCESREVAYSVRGRYSGVDAMVEHMVRYFRGEPSEAGGGGR